MATKPRGWTGARTPSALKRVRTAERRAAVNGPRRSEAKTLVSKAVKVASGTHPGRCGSGPHRRAVGARQGSPQRSAPQERRRPPQVAPDPQGQRRPRWRARPDGRQADQDDRHRRRRQGRQGPDRGRQVGQGEGRPDGRRQGPRRAVEVGSSRGRRRGRGEGRGRRGRQRPAKATATKAAPARKTDRREAGTEGRPPRPRPRRPRPRRRPPPSRPTRPDPPPTSAVGSAQHERATPGRRPGVLDSGDRGRSPPPLRLAGRQGRAGRRARLRADEAVEERAAEPARGGDEQERLRRAELLVPVERGERRRRRSRPGSRAWPPRPAGRGSGRRRRGRRSGTSGARRGSRRDSRRRRRRRAPSRRAAGAAIVSPVTRPGEHAVDEDPAPRPGLPLRARVGVVADEQARQRGEQPVDRLDRDHEEEADPDRRGPCRSRRRRRRWRPCRRTGSPDGTADRPCDRGGSLAPTPPPDRAARPR